MAPFYGWGSTASRLEPLRGGSLLFTTKFPEIPGTHFTGLGSMMTLEPPGEHGTPGLGNQHLNHEAIAPIIAPFHGYIYIYIYIHIYIYIYIHGKLV